MRLRSDRGGRCCCCGGGGCGGCRSPPGRGYSPDGCQSGRGCGGWSPPATTPSPGGCAEDGEDQREMTIHSRVRYSLIALLRGHDIGLSVCWLCQVLTISKSIFIKLRRQVECMMCTNPLGFCGSSIVIIFQLSYSGVNIIYIYALRWLCTEYTWHKFRISKKCCL